jgi:hypothetical protein
MTTPAEPVSPSVEPSPDAPPSDERHLPMAIVVLGLALLCGFVAIVIGTILSVAVSRPDTPDIEDLALPAGVDIVDSHTTCNASACDGIGVVVDRDGMGVADMVDVIARRLTMDGWRDDATCDAGARCLERDDLRIVIRPWLDVDETVAPAMRDSLTEDGIDQTRLVYLGYYRCGVLRSCS